jgi:PIN domain nuclease of toxin-antitoxin system
MIYVVDTHIFVWFLDDNKRLRPKHKKILLNQKNTFIFSAIVLAEIKYLISAKRININFSTVLEYLSDCGNCIIYPVDETVIDNMPKGLNIHDSLIVATGLIYKNSFAKEVFILTEDDDIKTADILPIA